ncbi:hypothetical protein QZH41_002422 [Actinostola sp. cb2023]|nr:hypothetical protein QZH41_002422 [Actinostola sp. cb2023]
MVPSTTLVCIIVIMIIIVVIMIVVIIIIFIIVVIIIIVIITIWPHREFPLKPVGQLVLNRNPKNYFAEIEQSAFNPANMVPGIEASPDKMLQV